MSFHEWRFWEGMWNVCLNWSPLCKNLQTRGAEKIWRGRGGCGSRAGEGGEWAVKCFRWYNLVTLNRIYSFLFDFFLSIDFFTFEYVSLVLPKFSMKTVKFIQIHFLNCLKALLFRTAWKLYCLELLESSIV